MSRRNSMRVLFEKLVENARLPSLAHSDDVGYDLHCAVPIVLKTGKVTKVSTGIALHAIDHTRWCSLRERPSDFNVPPEQIAYPFYPKVEGRSGMALRGIFPVGGIVDPGYRGELFVMLNNASDEDVELQVGDRVAQLVFYSVARPAVGFVEEQGETASDATGPHGGSLGVTDGPSRGAAGFGSTGR